MTQSGQLEIWAGEWMAAQIRRKTIVLPWLVSVFLLLLDGKAQRLMLWPDSTNADSFRKLRVWLKWGRQPKCSLVFLFYLSRAGS